MPVKLMRAIQYSRYGGGIASLKHVEIPVPEPKADELLIKLEAASLNPMDCRIQKGAVRPILPRKFPTIPGMDVAGEVVQIGSKVTKFKPGDKIVGFLHHFAYWAYVSICACVARTLVCGCRHEVYAEERRIGGVLHSQGELNSKKASRRVSSRRRGASPSRPNRIRSPNPRLPNHHKPRQNRGKQDHHQHPSHGRIRGSGPLRHPTGKARQLPRHSHVRGPQHRPRHELGSRRGGRLQDPGRRRAEEPVREEVRLRDPCRGGPRPLVGFRAQFGARWEGR